MKKVFLFAILITCLSKSYAQEKSFGFYGGANYSYFTNVLKPIPPDATFEAPIQNGLIGFHFGVLGQKKINSYFSINGTLGFSQKGAKYTGFNKKDLLNYVNFATNARFDYKRFFVEAGPEFGFLANSQTFVNGKEIRLFNFFDQKFDVLANFGIGAWLTKTTSISFRLSKGFLNTAKINLTDDNGTPIGTGSFFKNLTYQVSVCQMVF